MRDLHQSQHLVDSLIQNTSRHTQLSLSYEAPTQLPKYIASSPLIFRVDLWAWRDQMRLDKQQVPQVGKQNLGNVAYNTIFPIKFSLVTETELQKNRGALVGHRAPKELQNFEFCVSANRVKPTSDECQCVIRGKSSFLYTARDSFAADSFPKA